MFEHITLTFTIGQNLYYEVILWRQLLHPNILAFMGILDNLELSTKAVLVSRWMENGSILRFVPMKTVCQVIRKDRLVRSALPFIKSTTLST